MSYSKFKISFISFILVFLIGTSTTYAIHSRIKDAAVGALVGGFLGGATGSVVGAVIAEENPTLVDEWTQQLEDFASDLGTAVQDLKTQVNDVVKESLAQGIEFLAEFELLSPLLAPFIQEIYYEVYKHIMEKKLENNVASTITLHADVIAVLQPYVKSNLATTPMHIVSSGLQSGTSTVDCNTIYLHNDTFGTHINELNNGTFINRDAATGDVTFSGANTADNAHRVFIHELRHVDQCLRWGGRREYANVWLANLMITVGIDILSDPIGAIDSCSQNNNCVHDGMPMEKEASEFSERVIANLEGAGGGAATATLPGAQIPIFPISIFTNSTGQTIGVRKSADIFISYDYDDSGRISAERQHNVATLTPYWHNNFTNFSSGLTTLPSGYMAIANDKLVITTQNTGNWSWEGTWGTRSYFPQENVVFRTEVETGDTSDGRYLIAGVENSGGVYRRHAAYFDGDSLFVSFYNGGYQNVWLDTIADNTSYVVEVVTSSTGSTLYVYEKGQLRSSGFADTRTFTDWYKIRTFIEAQGYPGATAAKMYLDYWVESSASGKLVADVVAPEDDAVDFKAEYIYNLSGQLVGKVDYYGKLITIGYDANGQITNETRHDTNPERSLWSQHFTKNGSGYWDYPNSFMSISNGQLVVESQSTDWTWQGIWGKRSYDYSDKVVFRTELLTGSSSSSRYLLVGAEGDWSVGQYRRHTAYFDGDSIFAHYYDNGYQNVWLGTAKNNTRYIIELVTADTGTTLYIYEKGTARENGFIDVRSHTDWGMMQSFIEAQGYPGAYASKMYIESQSESKTAGALVGKYIVDNSIADVSLDY